jgi:hypothetical protein
MGWCLAGRSWKAGDVGSHQVVIGIEDGNIDICGCVIIMSKNSYNSKIALDVFIDNLGYFSIRGCVWHDDRYNKVWVEVWGRVSFVGEHKGRICWVTELMMFVSSMDFAFALHLALSFVIFPQDPEVDWRRINTVDIICECCTGWMWGFF